MTFRSQVGGDVFPTIGRFQARVAGRRQGGSIVSERYRGAEPGYPLGLSAPPPASRCR
jgi:hypothetical protein